ncbi:MAG: carboxypeptidase regulatory-like domain-containing protein [Zoogloea sp.]|nr:carboxypeptidase regulatory-like domain-containing protein [Zoogloea sp.]
MKVSLLDAAGNVVTTQTTDASGNYLFTSLKPGTYSVQFDKTTLPTGYVFTSKDVGSDAADSDADTSTGKTIQTVLDSGESDKTWDAGIVANPGSISGTVREDLDNNNSGDTPIAGVTVQLKDSTGTVVQTTTTDTNGNYTFNNVPAGTYTVVETNKPGYTDVGDVDGGDPNVITVTLPAGTSSTGNVFVDERPATLGDRVWEDKNANGVQDAGESGIANVTVQLKDPSGNVVQSTTTDANGNYGFTVTPGTYTVAVLKPAGYEITGQDLGGNEVTDSDINAAGQTAPVTLQSGQNNPNVDAGLYKLAELGDKVWYDTNKNGVQDAGEAGVQGVKVSLLDAAGNVVTTQTTDASGNYLFTSLKPGTYSVQFDKTTLPTGYVFTSQDVGSDAADSDADTSTGKTIQTVLDSGRIGQDLGRRHRGQPRFHLRYRA